MPHASRVTGLPPVPLPPPAMLGLLIATLLLPISFEIAGQRISPYRLFLLLTFIPFGIRWISGRAGGITRGDIFIALYCLWTGLAFFMVHGAAQIPFAGINVVELFGSYLAGRVLIRNAEDHRALFRYLLVALVFLAPFALIETITGQRLINNLFDPVFETVNRATGGEPRLGMNRVQAVFDHSIHFGLFCSIAIANLFYIHRDRLAKSLLLSGFATIMTFLSLSSAALLSAGMQCAIILWGRMTANAWRMLAILSVVSYVAIDLASNRTPVTILISYLTFSPGNAWARIRVWEYGMAEVWRHPLFGIGLNDWQRGWGLTSSVDNFWLATAMRAGIPAFLLLAAGLVANLAQIFRSALPPEAARYRIGYVITFTAIIMTLCTVTIWGAVSVFILLYFGAGMWFVNGTAEPAASISPAPRRGPARPETRPTRHQSEHPEVPDLSPSAFRGTPAARQRRLNGLRQQGRRPLGT